MGRDGTYQQRGASLPHGTDFCLGHRRFDYMTRPPSDASFGTPSLLHDRLGEGGYEVARCRLKRDGCRSEPAGLVQSRPRRRPPRENLLPDIGIGWDRFASEGN